jgi:hypothetical protein
MNMSHYRRRLILTLLFLLPGLAALTVHAEDLGAIVAKAEQSAAANKFEDAIGTLEDMSSTVIGDPAVVKAAELLPKYYASWCDALRKSNNLPELCRALVRFIKKQPDAAVPYEARDKTIKALEEWEAEAEKKKNIQPLLDFGKSSVAALGDEGKAWHIKLYKTALSQSYDARDLAPFSGLIADFAATYKEAVGELAPELRDKAVGALATQSERLLTSGNADEALQLCTLAQQLATDAKLAALHDKLVIQLARIYENLHDTELAKAYYTALIAKSTNTTLTNDAHKALGNIELQEKQLAKMTPLPAEISTNVVIKALPVPYSIPQTVSVKPTGSLTLEKGVCIRGGKIEFKNTSMTLKGTKESPIVLEDVEIASVETTKMTVTGEYVIFVRCPFTHGGNVWWAAQHKWSLKNCIFIGPTDFELFTSYIYDSIINCSFTRYKIWVCKGFLKPPEFSMGSPGPNSCNYTRCDVDPRLFWCLNRANFFSCKLMTDEKMQIKLHSNVSQKSLWFDKDSAFMSTGWKTYVTPDPSQSGKMDLSPALEKNSACGADWTTLSFDKPE